jgi:hypothetical protein
MEKEGQRGNNKRNDLKTHIENTGSLNPQEK